MINSLSSKTTSGKESFIDFLLFFNLAMVLFGLLGMALFYADLPDKIQLYFIGFNSGTTYFMAKHFLWIPILLCLLFTLILFPVKTNFLKLFPKKNIQQNTSLKQPYKTVLQLLQFAITNVTIYVLSATIISLWNNFGEIALPLQKAMPSLIVLFLGIPLFYGYKFLRKRHFEN